MPSKRAERTITISGKNGYVQLLPEEQKAIRVEIYFTATNVGATNYYSYEWYKERTLYGRVKIARGEYTTKEKLIQYQNELLYSEEATLFEIVKRLQCQNQKQYEVNKFLVEATTQVAAALNVVTGFGGSSTAFDQIPPQPIEIPGLQVDGLYYNMFPGCAGKIVVQTWYDTDTCKDVNNIDLTKDNRGDAPDPAFPGRPPAGTDANVPLPTFPKDGTFADPTPNTDVPTETLDNPSPIAGFTGTLYTVKIATSFRATGAAREVGQITIVGKYSGVIQRPMFGGSSTEWVMQTGIGVSTIAQPNYVQLAQSGFDAPGAPSMIFDGVTITPQ